MTTALEPKTDVSTSLARPSQRGSVAAPVKLLIHPHTDAVRRTLAARRRQHSLGPATHPLVSASLLYPPQSLASIDLTIKTHRAGVVQRFSPIHF